MPVERNNAVDRNPQGLRVVPALDADSAASVPFGSSGSFNAEDEQFYGADSAAAGTPAQRQPARSAVRRAYTPRGYATGSSRDEMNLAEFPLAVLSTRVNPGLKTLEFTDTHRSQSGELVERKWIITGADKFGLPTSTDDDVVLGLMRLSMAQGFRERKVYFTRYELLKTLRWSTEGRSYKRLIRSLDRLSGVRIRSTNSFYDNSSKAYQTCNFGLIDAYEINDERAIAGVRKSAPSAASIGPDELPKSFFIWSEALFDSFKAGYIKKLDLDLYFQLTSAVSRRLYRYLDKHFYYKGTIERTLLPFAFEKLGLSRTYKYVSSVRQQIEPALEELIRVGFLADYEVSGRGGASTIRFISAASGVAPGRPRSANGAGQNGMGQNGTGQNASGQNGLGQNGQHYSPWQNTSDSRSEFQPEIGSEIRTARHLAAVEGMSAREQTSLFGGVARAGEQPLKAGANSRFGMVSGPITGPISGPSSGVTASAEAAALVERGMAKLQAQKLVTAHSAETLKRLPLLLRYYDHLVAANDFKVSKNRVGFLYRAVQSLEDFQIPADFSGARPAQKRPELQLFEEKAAIARRAEQEDGTAEKRRRYQEFVNTELAQFLAGLTDAETKELYSGVETKMSCLRSVLTAEKFQEAIQGCVRQEIQRRLKLPAFERWAVSL